MCARGSLERQAGRNRSSLRGQQVNFDLQTAVAVLSRTPTVLDVFLRDLPASWTSGTEGPDTWSPYDVVGHLTHGERTDWIPRVEHLLAHGEAVPFPVFDRFAQFEASEGKSLPGLLDTFRELRAENLRRLAALGLTAADLERTGQHPEFGRVALGQHLATWVAHDLDHLVQIARVMGRQYAEAVGPWRQYLRIIGPA
ncbi:MAG: DinB family protein [Acidobacteriota bacterium]